MTLVYMLRVQVDPCVYVSGFKFVIKGVSGVRRQFVIVDNKPILAFTAGKFAECTTFTDRTADIKCKVIITSVTDPDPVFFGHPGPDPEKYRIRILNPQKDPM